MRSDFGLTVGQLVATDIDSNIPPTDAWQITDGNASGVYAIDDNGTLTVVDATATLTIQVTDAGALSDTALVTINLVGDALFADGFESL